MRVRSLLSSSIPLILIAFFASSCACGGGDTPSDTPKTDNVDTPKTDGARGSDDKAGDDKAGDDEPDDGDISIKAEAVKIKGDLKMQGKRYRQLLEQGRKQVRGGKIEEGIASFKQALVDDPNDPRLLGELSYACVQAGKYDEAIQAGTTCVKNTREDKVAGACWYNVGLAFDKKGDKTLAANAFRQSLARRPGVKAVEEKLAGLDAPPPPAQAVQACGGLPCTAAPKAAALCKPLLKHFNEQVSATDPGSCEIVSSRAIKTGDLKTLALLSLQVGEIGEQYYVLAMETEAGWRPADTVAYVYNPGAFGIYQEATLNITLKDVIEGGPTEVIVDVRHSRHDTDMGIAEYEDENSHHWSICGLDGDTPTCFATIPREYSYVREQDTEIAQADGIEINKDLPVKTEWTIEATFPASGQIKLTLKEKSGQANPAIRAFNGVHEIRKVPAVTGWGGHF